jgi:hypothetical protein
MVMTETVPSNDAIATTPLASIITQIIFHTALTGALGAPLNLKDPVCSVGELAHNLLSRIVSLGVPADRPVVLYGHISSVMKPVCLPCRTKAASTNPTGTSR